MTHQNTRIFLLPVLITLTFSCTNTTIEERHWPSEVKIENYTDIGFDSLHLHSSMEYSYYRTDTLIFKDLEPGAVSEYRPIEDLQLYIYFIAFVGDDTLKDYWYYPNFMVDPAGPVKIPTGNFHFGIVDCDTILDKLEIGLINYSLH